MQDRPGAAPEATIAAGIYAIVDVGACAAAGIDPLAAARAFCAARPAALQLRAKLVPDAPRLDLARRLAALCRTAAVPFLVNDRTDIAALADADGVHLGQDDLPPRDARRILGPHRLVGLSTHSPAQLDAAAAEPVDHAGYGPVFATRTKERPDPVVGLDGLRDAAARTRLPLVAIGGIRIEHVAAVRDAGARAVALISALLRDGDPAARIAEATAAFHTR